jgi:hypothetical protein
VIPMERFSEVMKIFCFAFGENMKWHFVGQEVQILIWGLQRSDFQSIHFTTRKSKKTNRITDGIFSSKIFTDENNFISKSVDIYWHI